MLDFGRRLLTVEQVRRCAGRYVRRLAAACSLFCLAGVAAADGAPPEAEGGHGELKAESEGTALVESRKRFAGVMERIGERMDRLHGKPLRIGAHMEAVVNRPGEGFPKVLDVLRTRVQLEKEALADLGEARGLYAGFAADSERERKRLLAMDKTMDREVETLEEDLDRQVKKLAAALGKEDLKLFKHFASVKTDMVDTLRTKLRDWELPELSAYFTRWEELLRTRLAADQVQIMNFAYCANSMRLVDSRNEAMKVVAELSSAPYLRDMGEDEINAVNMMTVLNAASANMMQTTYEVPSLEDSSASEAQGHPPTDAALRVSIRPDRGPGGVYYYGTGKLGLRKPQQLDVDGKRYYGEPIRFIIEANKACSIIVRHVDSRGRVKQLYPNEFTKEPIRLRPGVPLVLPDTHLPFTFVASEPPGIEVVQLIATTRDVAYSPEADRLGLNVDQYLAPQTSSSVRMRGIQIQARKTVASYSEFDTATLNSQSEANAVSVETFIRVLPKTTL